MGIFGKMKKMIVVFIIVFCILSFMAVNNNKTGVEREIIASPKGDTTIVVKYDFFSRPSIYKKGIIFNKEIWRYKGSGFMETVHFGVEWLSEKQIKVTYDDKNDEYDEEFIVNIP